MFHVSVNFGPTYCSDFMCTLVVKLMCDGQPSSDVLLLRTDTAFKYKRNIHLSLEPLGRAERERGGKEGDREGRKRGGGREGGREEGREGGREGEREREREREGEREI